MSEELKLEDERKTPRKGSWAWVRHEQKRFMDLSRKHEGLMGPTMAAVAIGVSRQRVFQLTEAGRITTYEILNKPFLACDEVEQFAALERTPAFRYSADSEFAT